MEVLKADVCSTCHGLCTVHTAPADGSMSTEQCAVCRGCLVRLLTPWPFSLTYSLLFHQVSPKHTNHSKATTSPPQLPPLAGHTACARGLTTVTCQDWPN